MRHLLVRMWSSDLSVCYGLTRYRTWAAVWSAVKTFQWCHFIKTIRWLYFTKILEVNVDNTATYSSYWDNYHSNKKSNIGADGTVTRSLTVQRGQITVQRWISFLNKWHCNKLNDLNYGETKDKIDVNDNNRAAVKSVLQWYLFWPGFNVAV